MIIIPFLNWFFKRFSEVTKNYTLIKSKPDSQLAIYVTENIDDYVSVVVESCNDKICDNEVVSLEILNNDNVSYDNKNAYIGVLNTTIQNLVDVEDDKLWQQLLVLNLVENTEKNVFDYYCFCEKILTDELIAFVNNSNIGYDYSEIRSEYENETQSAFFLSILKCNNLNNKHYREILKTLNRSYRTSGFSVENVSSDKILILIDIDVIPMLESSLLFLREHYPDAIMPYVKKYIDTYVNEILEVAFDKVEALNVLLLPIEDGHKLKLLEYIKSPLSANKSQYSDAIKAHILTKKFDESDIPHFIISYSSEGKATKSAIEEITLREVQDIFYKEYGIDRNLFDKLLATEIPLNTKIRLFASLLPSLDELQCKHYLQKLQLNDYLSLFENKRPLLAFDKVNKCLLSVFTEKKWITKYEPEDKDGESFYKAIGRKAQSKEKIEATV